VGGSGGEASVELGVFFYRFKHGYRVWVVRAGFGSDDAFVQERLAHGLEDSTGLSEVWGAVEVRWVVVFVVCSISSYC